MARVQLLTFLLVALVGVAARAAEPERAQWLPGDAREISRASSASRDTAVFEAIVAPRFSVTLGSEFGLVRFSHAGFGFRAGALMLFGLESRTRSKRLFPAPGGDSDLWRGILGYEVTASFEHLAKQTLGEHGALELAAGYYHESDHHTASNAAVAAGLPPDHADLRGRPQIGNFIAADFAARFRLRSLEVVVRHQSKLFVNGGATPNTPFRAGTGDELLFQLYELSPSLIPFWSTSAEVLLAQGRSPTRYFRSLLGVVLPGSKGELRLYASYDVGAGKGLLIPEHQNALGAGLRYCPFASSTP